MKSSILIRAVFMLIGLCIAGTAAAQAQKNDSQSGGQSNKSQSSGQSSAGATRDAPAAGVVPLGLTVEETAAVLKGWRASKLLHADVYNDENRGAGGPVRRYQREEARPAEGHEGDAQGDARVPVRRRRRFEAPQLSHGIQGIKADD
jgi:hypothetical protein